MYKLTIRSRAKSQARLLGRRLRTRYFIAGQKYEVYFEIQNIGDERSPTGGAIIQIEWPNSKLGSTWNFPVKSLEPKESIKTEKRSYYAFSTGLGWIGLNQIPATHPAFDDLFRKNIIGKDGKSTLTFHRYSDKKKITTNGAFDLIYSNAPEAIYEYLALWIAAIGLGIIAIQTLWKPFLYILSFLGI